MQIVFLNGAYLSSDSAIVSPFDRGLLFAHAAYEVTAVYAYQLIDFKGHTTRLARTLDALDIPNPYSEQGWKEVHEGLIERNDLQEGLIYLQVTGGDYGGRDFAGPETFEPNVVAFVTARPLIGALAETGMRAITHPDSRWARRDLKTTQLLSQAMAYRAAKAEGCETAIMHEDGMVTEAASASVFIVDADGRLRTRDLSAAILPSITRGRAIGLFGKAGLNVTEGAFHKDVLFQSSEVFTTSAGALIAPIVSIDNRAIGDGKPGPITRQVQRLYYSHMGVDLTAYPWLAA